MIVTDRFMFLHMPKTGGTFVETVLRRLRDEGTIAYQHPPRFMRPKHGNYGHIPERFRSMWKVVCLRQVVDHYVSHFSFGWWRQYPLDFFNNADALRQLPPDEATFSQFIRACNDPAVNHWRREHGPYATRYGFISLEWARFLSDRPEQFMETVLRDPMEAVEQVRRDRIYLLRQERLNEDLFAFLCRVGLPPAKVAFVLEQERVVPPKGVQKPRHRDWRAYLSEEDAAYLLDIEAPAFCFAPEYRIGLQC